MTSSCWKWLRSPLLASALLLGVALTCRGGWGPRCPGCTPTCLEDLQGLSEEELTGLFTRADVGTPFQGVVCGKVVYVSDRFLPRIKVRLVNTVWRGKAATPDGWFTNRWVGNRDWIDSHYVIGPSWIDGKPAILMEYAPDKPLFANLHDELREIAPGLYLGPIFERFPCPKFRGFVAVQMPTCQAPRCCGR